MLGELGEGESAAEGIPQELAHDLIHLMAHQKMVVETQHILSRCHTDDAMVVVGSDVKLRLDILAIDEALENALLNHDPNEPSKHFECLLERFDLLVRRSKQLCRLCRRHMRASISREPMSLPSRCRLVARTLAVKAARCTRAKEMLLTFCRRTAGTARDIG